VVVPRGLRPKHLGVTRRQYFHDPQAPVAEDLLPAAYAVVRNDRDEVLLVRRADDGNWELPGGRIEVGESAVSAAAREAAEEAGVAITVSALAGVYSDPRHVLVYPGDRVHQQIAICFHASALEGHARPDTDETTEAAWFEPAATAALPMHPTMRQRLANGLDPYTRAHYD
jgi:8-oxo-dGTP pyrophosphatase MutT (NUDIX family)